MVDGKIEKLTVLIDADNAQPSIVEGLLSEVAKYGTANVKRIYGDWTTSGLKGWKEILLQYSIQPIQQFGGTCIGDKSISNPGKSCRRRTLKGNLFKR